MKDIPEYEGLYGATEDGRIYSYIKNRYLTPCEYRTGTKEHQGYVTVKLSKFGSSTTYHVHDLICRAYKPKPAPNMEIDHLDEDRHNNSVDNLEWVTHEENMRRRTTHHYSIAIECEETGQRWWLKTEAARDLGVCLSTVIGHLKGKQQTISKNKYHLREVAVNGNLNDKIE